MIGTPLRRPAETAAERTSKSCATIRSGDSLSAASRNRDDTRMYASARRTNEVPSVGTGLCTRLVGNAVSAPVGEDASLIHETNETSQSARFRDSASRNALSTGFGTHGSVWRRKTAFREPTETGPGRPHLRVSRRTV